MILINKSYIISSPFSSFFKTSNGALSPRKGTGLHNHSLKASSEVCSLLPKDHIKSDTPSIGDFTSCPLEINSCLSVSVLKITYFIQLGGFNIVTDRVEEWLNFTKKGNTLSVLAKKEFERKFENDLQPYNEATIKEFVETYG